MSARTALLCPGQGSQVVGMASDLIAASANVRALYERASEVLGWDAIALSTEGPADALRMTQHTQPCLFLHTMAVCEVLGDRLPIDATAGHSLGEYSALVIAGVLTLEDALNAVKLRGELMAHAGESRPGAMAAVLLFDAAAIADTCARVSAAGDECVVANYNGPDQTVISGDVAAVERAMGALAEAGAKRIVRLPVSGAFHSPLMAPAAEQLAHKLDALTFRTPRIGFVANASGQAEHDPGRIRALLIQQLTAPVRWTETMQTFVARGVERYVEAGPGNVLVGMAKRLAKGAQLSTAGTWDEIAALTSAANALPEPSRATEGALS